jgi:large repetitive protein
MSWKETVVKSINKSTISLGNILWIALSCLAVLTPAVLSPAQADVEIDGRGRTTAFISPLEGGRGETVTCQMTVTHPPTTRDSVYSVSIVLPPEFAALRSITGPDGWTVYQQGDILLWIVDSRDEAQRGDDGERGSGMIPPGGRAGFSWTFTLPTDAGSGDEYRLNWLAMTTLEIPYSGFGMFRVDAPDLTLSLIEVETEAGVLVPEGDGSFYVDRGEVLTYRFEVSNVGTAVAEGVEISSPVPPVHTFYLPNSTTLNGASVSDILGQCPLNDRMTVEEPGGSAGEITPGASAVVEVQVQTDPNLWFEQMLELGMNIYSIAGLEAQISFSGPVASGAPPLVSETGPAVILTPLVSMLGEPVDYIFSLHQAVTDTDSVCAFNLTLPDGFTGITGGTIPPGWSLWLSGQELIWTTNFPNCIPPDGSLDLGFSAVSPGFVGAGGDYNFHHYATTSAGSEWLGRSTVHVQEPDLSGPRIELIDENGGKLQRGDFITYRLSCVNTGDMGATGVEFRAPVPSVETDYVPGSTVLEGVGTIPDPPGGSALVGGMLVSSFGQAMGMIATGDSAVVTTRVQVRLNASYGSRTSMRMYVSSDTGHGGNVRSDRVRIVPAPATIALDSVSEDTPCVKVPFTMTLGCDGPGTAFDCYSIITLPENFSIDPTSTLVTAGANPPVPYLPTINGNEVHFNNPATPLTDDMWDIPAGEVLVITFDIENSECAPGVHDITATGWSRAGEYGEYSEIFPDAVFNFGITEGILALDIAVPEPPAYVTDLVSWDIRVHSIGTGDLPLVNVEGLLEKGLRFDHAVPAPSNIFVAPSGVTELSWYASMVPGLERVAAGDMVTITVFAELTDCHNYNQHYIAEWGCGPESCGSATTVGSVDLQLDEPELSIIIDPAVISVPSCDGTGEHVTLTVQNAGGLIRDLRLEITHPQGPLMIQNVVGAVHIPGPVDLLEVGDVTGTQFVEFDIRHDHSCETPGGGFIVQPIYTNACDIDFHATPVLTSVATNPIGSLSLNLQGPIEVQEGEIGLYDIVLTYSDGIPPNAVSLTAVYPDEFEFQGVAVGSLIPDTGSAVGSLQSSWLIAPGEFDPVHGITITISLMANLGDCGYDGVLTAAADLPVPCGEAICERSSSASLPLANDCPDGPCDIGFIRTVNGELMATVEPCSYIEYENIISLANVPVTLSWGEIVFEADAAAGQRFLGYLDGEGNLIDGRMELILERGGLSCTHSIMPTRNADNRIELAFDDFIKLVNMEACDFGGQLIRPTNTNITLRYVMTAPQTAGMFFDYGRLVIDHDTVPDCNGIVAEPVEISVVESTMDADLILPAMVDACGADAIVEIRLTKSGLYGAYDNVLYFSTAAFEYLDDPEDPDYFLPIFDNLPDVGVPTRVNDIGNGDAGVMWKLGDIEPGFSSGSIFIPVRKRCDDDAASAIRLVYDNHCDDDDTDNIDDNAHEVIKRNIRPVMVRYGDVTFLLTPENVYADDQLVTWNLHLTNGGSGAAHNVEFHCRQDGGEGITFTSGALFDAENNRVRQGFRFNKPRMGTRANGWIRTIPAGETWRVRIKGTTNECSGLIHTIRGEWGCLDEVCQAGEQMRASSTVTYGENEVLAMFTSNPNLAPCTPTQVQAMLKNASLTRIYDTKLSIALPPELNYISNSTLLEIHHAGSETEPTVINGSGNGANPKRDGLNLVWELADYLSANYLSSEDTVLVTFQVDPEATFNSGNMTIGGEYVSPCGEVEFISPDTPRLEVRRAVATNFTSDGSILPITICSPNNGEGNTELVWLNNGPAVYGPAELLITLPPGLRYTENSGVITYPRASGVDGVLNTDPDKSGNGETDNPYRLTWALPSDMEWSEGDELSLILYMFNPTGLNCEHFTGDDPLLAEIAPRICPGVDDELPLGPFEYAIHRAMGGPELNMAVLDITPNGTLTAGDELAVTLQIANYGDARMNRARLDLIYPDEFLEWIGSTPNPNDDLDPGKRWRNAYVRLDPGESAVVEATLRVKDGAPEGVPFEISSRYYETCCNAGKQEMERLILGGAAGLELQLTATEAVLVPGEPISYSLTINNTGEQALRKVRVRLTPDLPGMAMVQSDYDHSRVVFVGTPETPVWVISRNAAMADFEGGESEEIRVVFDTVTDESVLGTPPGSGSVTIRASIPSAANGDDEPIPSDEPWDVDFETVMIGAVVADMDLQVVPSTGTIVPGDEFTYLVTLTNTGRAELSNVEINVPIPDGFTYSGYNADEQVGTPTGANPLVFPIPALDVDASKLLAVNFNTSPNPADLINPTSILLTADGTSPSGAGVQATFAMATSPLSVPGVGMDIYKLADTGVVVPGSQITYTIFLTNTGDQTLYNIEITDQLPPGFTLISANLPPGASYISQPPLMYMIPELDPGESQSLSLTCLVDSDLANLDDPSDNILNAIGLDQSGEKVFAAEYILSLPLALVNGGLDIEFTNAEPVVIPGERYTFFLTITNRGGLPLRNVTVLNTLPSQLTFESATYDGDITQGAGTNPQQFDILQLASYSSKTIGITCTTDPDYSLYPAVVTNEAAVTGETGAGVPVLGDKVITDLTVVPKGASFMVSKVNSDPSVIAGTRTTYLITVTNTGTQDLTDVVIYDRMQHNLSYTESQLGPRVDFGGIDPGPPQRLRFEIPSLPIHASEIIAVTFDVAYDPWAGWIWVQNELTGIATDEGGETVECLPFESLLPMEWPAVGLKLDKKPTQGEVVPGGTVTYIITCENNGEMTVSNIVINESVVPGLTYAFSNTGPGVRELSGTPPSFSIGHLAPGTSGTVTVTYNASEYPGDFHVPVTNYVTGTGIDPAEITVVAEPDTTYLPLADITKELDIQKVATADRIIPGREINYLITVTNTGERELSGLTVTDSVPDGLTLSQSEFDGDGEVTVYGTNPPTYGISRLRPNEATMLSLTFEITNDPFAINDPIVNKASVDGYTNEEELVVADPDYSSLPLMPEPGAIDVEKVAVESPFTAGDLGHYIITVTNTGSVPLTDVTVSDLLEQGLSYVDAEPAPVVLPPNPLEWELADLEPGEAHTIILSVAVDYDLHGETVSNTVTATGNPPSLVTVTDVDVTETPCQAEDSSIHVEKLANETRLIMGGQVSYHILVTNDGSLPLSQVTVRDSIPEGLSFVNADFDNQMVSLVSTDPLIQLEFLQPLEPTSVENISLFFNASRDYIDYQRVPGDSTVTNQVHVTGIDPVKKKVEDDDTAELELLSPRAAIQVHYTHTTSEVIPSERSTYLVTIENIGDQVLSDVLLQIPDLAAQGLNYEISNYDIAQVYEDHITGFHQWRLVNPLPKGAAEQIRISYIAESDIGLLPAVVTSVAQVSALDEEEKPVGDMAEEAVPLSPKRGAISIDNTAAQGEVRPGELVTYQLTIQAGAELDLTDVVVIAQDLTAQGLTLFDVDYDQFYWSRTTDFQFVHPDTFPAGHQEEIRMTYRADEDVDNMPTIVTMTAHTSALDIYSRFVEDDDLEELPVLLPESHLLLEKITLASAVVPGEPITYLLTATNNGNQDLSDVTIEDHLPSQMETFASYYDSTKITFIGGAYEPTWTYEEDLEPGEAFTVRLVATTDPDPTLYNDTSTNTAEATAIDEGDEELEALAADTVPVHEPDIAVDIAKVPNQNLIIPDGTASYVLLVQNVGRVNLESSTVTEEIPAGLTYTHSIYDANLVTLTGASTDVTWEIGLLEPGRAAEIQVFFDVSPDPTVIANPVVNRATVESYGPGNTFATDMARAELPVQESEPGLLVEKRATVSVAEPGEMLEYAIHVTNNGNLPLTGVTVEDSLIAGLTFMDSRYDTDLVQENHGFDKYVWEFTEEMEPGDRTSIYLSVLITAAADSIANPVTNTALAYGYAPGELYVSDKATEILPLQAPLPRITVQKFTDAPVAKAGEEILYTIQVTNTGNRDIERAYIRDMLPAGVTYVSSVYDQSVISPSPATNTTDPLWTMFNGLRVGATETITVRLRVEYDTRVVANPIENVVTVEAWDIYGDYFMDSDFETTPVADPEPALNLDVLATSGTIVPGDLVTYLISLTNTGDQDLQEVAITDTLPDGLSIFSTNYDPIHVTEQRGVTQPPHLRSGLTSTGQEYITWTMESLPLSAIEQIRLTLQVTENTALLDSVVTHTLMATASDIAGNVVTDYDSDALPVAAVGSAISLSKTALSGDVVPGDLVSYLLTVRNGGESDLHNVRLNDEIPTGLFYKQSDFDNTVVTFTGADSDSAVWTIADLPVGGFEQMRVTYRAASEVVGNVAADSLETTATVSALDPSAETVTDSDSETLPIHPDRSSVQILKETDYTGQNANRGTEVAWHVRVHNTGDQDLSPVSIIDYLPAGLRFLEADVPPDSVAVDANETRVYWSLEALSHVDMWEVLVKARIDSLLVNGATLQTHANVLGIDERGEEVRDTDLNSIQAGLPDITIDKIVDHPLAKPGEKLTYSITYRNSGNVDGENVVVTDILPPQMTYVAGSASGGAFYEPRFNSITRAQDRLEIDGGAIFSYQVVLDDDIVTGTRIPNTATVYADGVSPAESDTAWVMVADKAAEIVKVVDKTVATVGDELTYTLYYYNLSEDDYSSVSIADPVPSEVDYISGSAEPGAVYDPGTRILSWDLGALDAGHVGSVTFGARVRPEANTVGRVVNEASMTADDLTVPSNRAVTLIVEDRGVAISKLVNLDLAVPGDTLSYTLTLENIGPSPLTAIEVSDAVPTELTYIDNATGASEDPDAPEFDESLGRLTWYIGVIEPGESTTIVFSATVNDKVHSGTMVTNHATVQTNETQPIVSNPANTLIQYPELFISKVPDRSQVVVGEEVTYTVTVTNGADGVTDSTWVTDLLPAGFSYVTGSTVMLDGDELISEADPVMDTDDVYSDRESLVWTMGRLGAYAEITLTYRALITGEAGPGYHDNYAIACGVTPLLDELCTDPAIATIEVVVPSLTITKTTAERAVDLGDVILYSIGVQNNSTAPVVDLEIRDHLPTGFQIMPGSSRLNGAQVSDPLTLAAGLSTEYVAGPMGRLEGQNVLIWTIDELGGGEELSLTYICVVGLNSASGIASNQAEAVGLDMGTGKVVAGPAEARVWVLDDELPGRLRGRVIIDCDGDGKPDIPQEPKLRFSASGTVVDEDGNAIAAQDEAEIMPYQNVEILVEDGRRAVTNEAGEFFIYPLQWGDHVVYLDPRTLEEGTTILSDDSQFFTVLEGGEARIDFRICPPPPKQGSIQLLKSVSPDEVIAIKRVIEPEVFTLEGIYFDTGMATLKPEAAAVLAEAAKRIIEDPTATIAVEGHTDIRPIKTRQFPDNYALSEGRAAVVRDALIEQYDLDASRFSVAGFGPDRPVAPNTTAANLSLNRRTEIILLPSLADVNASALFTPSTVTFTVKVIYEGTFDKDEGAIREAYVYDEMAYGLEYLLGTTRINGQPADDPELRLGESSIADDRLVEGERYLAWKLGIIYPGDVVEITYETVIADVPASSLERAGLPRVRYSESREHVARVDGLLRDDKFRSQGHLWENTAWFEGVRSNAAEVSTEAAGADLKLSFERILEPIRITIDDVLFDTGEAILRPEAYGVLNPAADIIRARSLCKVQIEGHTDIRPISTDAFPSNQELSDARAKAVRDYFIEVEGLDRNIFTLRGFGPRRPVADNTTTAGRQKNRRTEIVISGDEERQKSFQATEGKRPRAVKVDLR